MTCASGIDVGTTFTAAAVWRDERVEVVALEAHRVTVPTVIAVEGDELRYGSAAISRGIANPDAAARGVQAAARRLGPDLPRRCPVLGRSAGRAVRQVGATTPSSRRRARPPISVAVTHPANWTEFQRHLLSTALEQAGVPSAALIAEPQAAAIDFGSVAHLEPGQLVLVYDLGGGTFDVAILRRDADGFTSVGVPRGVERLGGIDFDEAVVRARARLTCPSRGDRAAPATTRPVASGSPSCAPGASRPRRRSSSDVSVDIPVLLPGLSSTVRLTRQELEDMVRPMLRQTVELARQALDRARIARSSCRRCSSSVARRGSRWSPSWSARRSASRARRRPPEAGRRPRRGPPGGGPHQPRAFAAT